jgi:hypothetical protein
MMMDGGFTEEVRSAEYLVHTKLLVLPKYRCPRQKAYGDDPLFDAGDLGFLPQPAYPTALLWYRTDILILASVASICQLHR